MIIIEQEFIVETTPDKTGPGSIYQLIFRKNILSINKGKFHCKQLKGKNIDLSKEYVLVTALIGEKSKFDDLKLEIDNLKPGVSIWMKDNSRTSRISKVFIRYK